MNGQALHSSVSGTIPCRMHRILYEKGKAKCQRSSTLCLPNLGKR